MEKPILAAFLSCEGCVLTSQEKKIFEKANPLGISIFSRNIKNKQQIKNLIKEIKETIGRKDLLIAVDQEGGRVRRLTEPDFFSYSAQIDIGALPLDEAVKASELHAKLISLDLKEMEINVNFAPVLDIIHPKTTPALKSRCFSSIPQTVSLLGKTMVEEYTKKGILPCIKHIPGHGLAENDPHLGLPIIKSSLEEIIQETLPFQTCSNAPLGMTAHILIEAIDKENPLTQSNLGIKKLIREIIGFKGLLISDSIDMKALKGNIVQKATNAINAGCDCICYCMGNIDELEALSVNCPNLSDAALERLDKSLQILHNTNKPEEDSVLRAQYTSLMGKISPYNETYDATEVLHQLQKKD